MTPSSAGTAHPARSARRSGMLGEARRAGPARSPPTLRRETAGPGRGGDPRADERQLCRCGAYVNIVAAIDAPAGADEASSVIGAPDPAAAARGRRRPAEGAVFLGGGTNLVDLMKLGVEAPGLLVDVTAPAVRLRSSDRRRRVADRRGGAQQRPGRRPGGPAPLPGPGPGGAGRGVGAASQHGYRRRQPAAADSLPVLPGCHQAVQQAGAAGRAARPGTASTTIWPSWARRAHCVATHPSDMAVALAALDAVVHVEGAGGTATVPLSEFYRLPGDEPERETTLEPRRR